MTERQHEDYATPEVSAAAARFITQQKRSELEVIGLVIAELVSARNKFPKWPHDNLHAAAIVGGESGELLLAAVQHDSEGGTLEACDKGAIQTAAMCIRFLMRG